MSESTSAALTEDEAELLWLGRAIGDPDAWRSRATNAAGLLSAAAAATLVGLLLHGEQLSAPARVLAVLAGGGYAVAVLCYLIAAVWPSPPEDKQTLHYADEIWAYCGRESKPIKRMVIGGTVAGAFAVICTAIAVGAVAVGDQHSEKALVTLTSSAPDEVSNLCPGLPDTFSARVENLTDTRVRLHLPRQTCSNHVRDIELSRSAILIAAQD